MLNCEFLRPAWVWSEVCVVVYACVCVRACIGCVCAVRARPCVRARAWAHACVRLKIIDTYLRECVCVCARALVCVWMVFFLEILNQYICDVKLWVFKSCFSGIWFFSFVCVWVRMCACVYCVCVRARACVCVRLKIIDTYLRDGACVCVRALECVCEWCFSQNSKSISVRC
jgi:hypothetical protein